MRTPRFRSFPKLNTFAANLILILLLAPAIAAHMAGGAGGSTATSKRAVA